MLSGIWRTAIIICVFALFYLLDVLAVARFDRQRQQGGTGRNQAYTIFAITLGLAIAVQPVVLPVLGLRLDAPWALGIQLAGLGLCAAALGLNWWARMHLQHYYTEGAELQPDHHVIDTGPYAQVRHPVFTSLFMLVGGLLLVNPSVVMAAVVVYTIADFTQAARRDEELLADNLPGYRAYMEQTPRFFPRIFTP
ncbi:MAG: methyltransferase family protein [Anaerolineae bacterium]